MEHAPRLYDTLFQVLAVHAAERRSFTSETYHNVSFLAGHHRQWLDVRHMKTLVWMMVGLIESGLISLTQ